MGKHFELISPEGYEMMVLLLNSDRFPACSMPLFVPGVICGLSQFTRQPHLIRAALEAVGFQAGDVLNAMAKEMNLQLTDMMVSLG